MIEGGAGPTQATNGAGGWYRPLVALYGFALILSNPLIAFGLFYVVVAVWLVLAYVALRHGSVATKNAARALLVAVLVWTFAAVPAFLFVIVAATAMWYGGELASIALATLVMAGLAKRLSNDDRRTESLRRVGLAAGLATALQMLLPIAFYFVPDFEVAAIFNPILFYLPCLVMLVTAAVAAASFALIPGLAQER